MLALSLALAVSPAVGSPFERCKSDLQVEMLSTNTTTGPACHRGFQSNHTLCVLPAGFPPAVCLGLALSGMDTKSFLVWVAEHPSSGFNQGSAWEISPDDVSLLGASGVACEALKRPSPSPVPPSAGAVAAVVVSVLCLCGAAGVALAAYKLRRKPSELLLDSTFSVYT